jgi:gamma-glutamyltranspeptidase / glutathione hydrolase
VHAQTYTRGAVATPHYLASSAGLETLVKGGNAVDAIVAANLALGVVAPYYCGYGGDLLAIVWDGAAHGYRSTGRSPAAATPDFVRADGHDEMPVFGPHAVTVPGAIRGWFDLLERFGTRSFGELATRAIAIAEAGFVLTKPGAFRVRGSIGMIEAMYPRGAEQLAATYAGAADGALLRLPALARTIRTLAEDGPDAYYAGPIGDAIVETLREHGSAMTTSDFARHAAEWVVPMTTDFADRTVLELPPPTQGVTALEMLTIADGLDATRRGGAERDHVFIETAKLALADRDRYVTDPAHMSIDPMALIEADHVERRRSMIGQHARPMEPRRTPDGGTAYLCAADADGLCVSLIQSNFTAIGAGVHVPEWGINLHNRGSSFSLDADHVNVLAGAKLPMHTLIPALVLRDNDVEYVFGTMGGHAQAQVHLQVLTRLLVDGDDPQSSIDAPRWSVDPANGTLAYESRFATSWVDDLRDRGHQLRPLRAYDDGVGHAHAIERTAYGLRAGCDPRAESAALGL